MTCMFPQNCQRNRVVYWPPQGKCEFIYLIPILVWEFMGFMPPLDPAAVDQNRDIMAVLEDLFDETLDLLAGG